VTVTGSEAPSISRGANPQEQARNIAAWLRARS
jgi:hypothetical protein